MAAQVAQRPAGKALIMTVAIGVTGIRMVKTANALDPALLHKAARVRATLPKNLPSFDSDDLFFPSAYKKKVKNGRSHVRGFCNWLLPGRLMVGQYPGQTPEPDGPTSNEVEEYLSTLVNDAGVNLFCSLQSELPPQDDYEAWNQVGGKIHLPDPRDRRTFPSHFSHYAPTVSAVSNNGNTDRVQYLHWPIDDLSIPEDSQSLQGLLGEILTTMVDTDVDGDLGRLVYLHCWGGRGRAGLTAACLVSLLYPELEASRILEWIQVGYDSRLGAEQMPWGLSRSPQTESQRKFVQDFVNLRRRQQQQSVTT